ncbi:right-handed parallel beta-helix repeat-containing protein [Marinicella pacifica]|nr:right-handed parallel beta-helix repeat-containing protein [Marinicella pacifica]
MNKFLLFCLLTLNLNAVMAATFTVNYNDDDLNDPAPADGVCETAIGNGQCTLRAAIDTANYTPNGPHTVQVPYLENDSYPVWAAGGIWITTNMTVRGTGAGKAVIEGDLFIESGMIKVGSRATVENLEFRPNTSSGSYVHGLYVNSLETATLNDITIIPHSSAAGLAVFDGKLICNRCEIRDGDYLGLRIFGSGGNNESFVTLNQSRITGNTNTSNHQGGGVRLQMGHLIIKDSLIDNNQGVSGGGIYSHQTGTSLHIINSTISQNKAMRDGGGIFAQGPIRLENATITQNAADYDDFEGGTGGGIYINDFTVVTAKNSIIHGNYLPCPTGVPLCLRDGRNCDDTQGGTIGIESLGWVMTGNDDNCPVTDLAGEPNYTSSAIPKLGPLTQLGGLHPVHPIIGEGSEADGGDPDGCTYHIDFTGNPVEVPLDYDQRGMSRPLDSDTNVFDGNSCDIGAYEAKCFGDDPDGDYVGSQCDVCPNTFDPLQEDGNSDGIGDACSDDLIFYDGFEI